MIFHLKPFRLFILATVLILTYPSISYSEALKTQNTSNPAQNIIKFGEWSYYPQSNPPTLMWWNERMSQNAPILYISFFANKITFNVTTPLWPNTGIIFYLKDKTEKQAVNLILQKRDQNHCYYSAIIDYENRQNFINNFVTSRKARLITPISSHSLSLKQIDKAIQFLLKTHPEINLSQSQDITVFK